MEDMGKERKKILFIDVDGTLADYRGRIPASAAEAVRRARKAGHRVYICPAGPGQKSTRRSGTWDWTG